jgi:hypothetical protein
VASPLDPVFGTTIRTASDGGTVTLQPDQPVTLPAVTGRLRAVGFTPTGDVPVTLSTYGSTDWVDVVVRDATGMEVTHTRRLTGQMASGTDFLVPTAADDVADGTRLTVTLTLHAPVPVNVAATGSQGGRRVPPIRHRRCQLGPSCGRALPSTIRARTQ